MAQQRKMDQERMPKDDPVEGARDVIEEELRDKVGSKTGDEEKASQTKRPASHPPREGKELGPKGVP